MAVQLLKGQIRPGGGGCWEFREGWSGASPYRKLSSVSATGPGELESCGCSSSASGSACGSSWRSRGLSQEMVEEVLTSFKVELEERCKSERNWGTLRVAVTALSKSFPVLSLHTERPAFRGRRSSEGLVMSLLHNTQQVNMGART